MQHYLTKCVWTGYSNTWRSGRRRCYPQVLGAPTTFMITPGGRRHILIPLILSVSPSAYVSHQPKSDGNISLKCWALEFHPVKITLTWMQERKNQTPGH
ncbi:hypothetical protein HPG69_012681 [Diceros bicornis minor]|uniref:Ig-like domain-containing protein n=1 Tax=Diceros bicornis minor TaxID=77932 RepID=A0A7J7EIK6_DICBM|nr:hypothetical protein HPG69_012681 [Diceros bicornis minor]